MGIDTRAQIIVGLPYGEIEHDDLDDMIAGGEVDACSPYFDAPFSDCIVGVEVLTVSDYAPLDLQLLAADVEKAKARFKDTFAKDGKVWLSPYVF